MTFAYYPTAWELARIEGLRSVDRLVLLAIVEHADETGECYPSQKRLAAWTGYSPRTVRGALARLEQLGFIERSSRGNERGGRSSDRIRLRIPKAARSAAKGVEEGIAATGAAKGVTGNRARGKAAGGAEEPHSEPVATNGDGGGRRTTGVVGQLGRLRPLARVGFASASRELR